MNNNQIKKRLFSFLKGKRMWYLLGLTGTSSFTLIFNTISGYGLKYIIDSGLTYDKDNLNISLLLLLLGTLLLVIITPFMQYTFESTYKKIVTEIKKRLYCHIQKAPLSFYEANESGDIISRINNDMDEVRNFYGDRICDLTTAFISGIGSAILMYSLNWELATVSIVLGFVAVYSNALFSKRVKKLNKEIQVSKADCVDKFSNIVSGFTTIKLYDLTNEMQRNYGKLNRKIYLKNMELGKIYTFLTAINSIIGSLNFIGLFMVGCYFVYLGDISIGTVLAVLQLRNGCTQMFRTIGDYVISVQKSYAGAERVFEIFDTPDENNLSKPEEPSDSNNLAPYTNDGSILFRNIRFSYNNRKFNLDNINIEANKGEMIALVGSSGSGKSTLFKLLLGFYDFNGGNIFINNKDIRSYSKEQMRRMFSYVQQEPYMFNGTIRDNIGLGKENPSQEDIVKASQMAFADEFIRKLPQGYDTIVGEEGVKLSGGQNQRIAIARAFLKNAPFLLLDEVTSALDSDSESKIQSALKELIKDKTTIVIAHRLSTIKNADRIYVLDNGKIIESGNHLELIKNGIMYKNLYKLQLSHQESKEYVG